MKFYARGNQLYPVPLRQYVSGQFPQFVGRELKPGKTDDAGKQLEGASWPASSTPWECPDRGALAAEIKREFSKCAAAQHEPPLWPADEATAARVGVKFVRVEVVDGVARPVGAAPKETK